MVPCISEKRHKTVYHLRSYRPRRTGRDTRLVPVSCFPRAGRRSRGLRCLTCLFSESPRPTCGKDWSPSACIFSFIKATFAAVALFFAPFRRLLAVCPVLESEKEG